MNAKKLKKLRQLVRAAARDTTGEPLPAVGYSENTLNRKYVNVEKVSGDGKSTYKDREQIASGTIRVEPRTMRGVYRGMKRKFEQAMAA